MFLTKQVSTFNAKSLHIKNLRIRKLNNLLSLTVNDRAQNLVSLALKPEWKVP